MKKGKEARLQSKLLSGHNAAWQTLVVGEKDRLSLPGVVDIML